MDYTPEQKQAMTDALSDVVKIDRRGASKIGVTRKSHEESKARRKMAAKSRARNRR